jgi:hypothetical protein
MIESNCIIDPLRFPNTVRFASVINHVQSAYFPSSTFKSQLGHIKYISKSVPLFLSTLHNDFNVDSNIIRCHNTSKQLPLLIFSKTKYVIFCKKTTRLIKNIHEGSKSRAWIALNIWA